MPSNQYNLPHDNRINIFVYQNVTTPSIKQSINQSKLPVTLLNGQSIYSAINVCQAVQKAFSLNQTKEMKTKSIHSEIAYQLASSSHIPAALEKMEYNQTNNQTNNQSNVLVAVALNATDDQLVLIDQTINPSNDQSINRTVNQLSSLCDLKSIKESYKITPAELSITQSISQSNNQTFDPVVAAIAGRIAIK